MKLPHPLFTLALACVLSANALAKPTFFDNFNAPDSPDVNSLCAQRQSGPANHASYRIATVMAPGGNASGDRFAIKDGALAITSSGSRKGPASLCLDHDFEKPGPRCHIEVTARPVANWAALLWTPFKRGDWPDASAGLSLIIQPDGTWTVWNNTDKPKQIIGRGKVTHAEKFHVVLDVDETDGNRLTLSINGVPVIRKKEFSYNATSHYVILQTNGQAEFDDLEVGPRETTKAATVWVEAEDYAATNFPNGLCVSSGSDGVSGAMLMRLAVAPDAQFVAKPPYFAEYKLSVPSSGRYNLWISASTQVEGWACPVSYSIDGAKPVSLKGVASVGKYGNGRFRNLLGWVPAGLVDLKRGEHTLKLIIDERRAKDGRYEAYFDAILFSSDLTFVPDGNHPSCSPQPTWKALMEKMTPQEYGEKLDRAFYNRVIVNTHEEIGPATAAEVLRKIKARPLPDAKFRTPDITEFGLHGMERPFVRANGDRKKYEAAYDLLARTGVDSFRTAESCWHRLAQGAKPGTLNFADLDYQVASAQKYGQTHLFTVGYPPSQYTVGGSIVSAVKPEFMPQYEEYLRELLQRYKGKGVRYVELGNEVDAPATWWRKSTPEMYVEEMKVLRKVVNETAPEMKIAAFAATYSRDGKKGGPNGGRRFVDKAMELGIDSYVDAYSIHHTSHLAAKDFPAFIRREMAKVHSSKPLLDSEQWGEGPYPYDNVKAFARCFFLYDMKRVDFFIARDFCENGYTKAWGLFDIDWNPKLRLLGYAFSVDAMKGRKLTGIARFNQYVEAYVLEDTRADTPSQRHYSIILWNDQREVENLDANAAIQPVKVGGFKGVTSANTWRLDPLGYDKHKPAFEVGDAPIAVYTSEPPDWKLMNREEFLAGVHAGQTEAP